MTGFIHLAYWQVTVVKVIVLLVVLAVLGVVVAHLLARVLPARARGATGPADTGPGGGLQPAADLAKAAQKEDGTGAGELATLVRAAPVVALAAAAVVAALVPAGPRAEVIDSGAGTLLMVVGLLTSTTAAAFAAAASDTATSRLAARRVARQALAAAPVVLVAVLSVGAQAGTFALQGIVRAQGSGVLGGIGTFGEPYVIPQVLGAVTFCVAQQGLRARSPFDGPRRLGGGSRGGASAGLRALLLPAAELAAEIAVAGVVATLFFGGWALPGVGSDARSMDVAGPVVLAVKVVALLLIGRWVELVLPRRTTARFVEVSTRVLLPIAAAGLVCTVVVRGLW